MTSGITGFTLPGMMEEPFCMGGRLISSKPHLGPEDIRRRSFAIFEQEIAQVFAKQELPPEQDWDDGVIGDAVGQCPLCGSEVRRTKFGYGCSGYTDGCKFGFQNVICGRTISLANARMLLASGRTSKIEGFIGKSGKTFSAALVLRDGRAVFDFNDQQNFSAK